MSYTKCVYHNCGNKSSDISMFRFPVHNQARLILWIRNSGNIHLDSLTHEELRRRYICAAHFLPSSIHKGSIRNRLIGPAVPVHYQSVELGEGSSNITLPAETANVDMNIDVLSSPEVLKVKTPTKFYEKQTRTFMAKEATISTSPSLSSTYNDVNMNTPTQCMSRMFEGTRKRLSRKCLFEEKSEDTPKTKRLKRTASTLFKKSKAQCAQISRLRAKSKQSIKQDYPTEFSKTLALMQLRKKNDKKKWTTVEENVCLSLFYKSPATYNFMRRQGVVLAAPSTIRMWLAKSNCLPGLCSDTFEKIQKKFENASMKEKACVICFDEMSIMANLEYSKKYDIIEGFEDFGGNQRSNKIAKYALVFVVRALYDQWKLPVAYFLSNSNVKAEMLQLLLKAVINKLFDHGLLPKVVVCDQATTNQTTYKKLGVSNESPFFFCNGKKLFALFDVPHLVKSIRNNFLKNDFIHGKEEMSFQDIVKTYEIDKKSNTSRSLTKITDRHIDPNSFQKMTVSLATQIFSNSVAAAIKTVKSTGQLNSNTANATAKFIEIVNNMFDALNSKNQFDSNPYKHAISNNSKYAFSAIIEAKNMFEVLQKIVYKNEKDGQKKKIFTRPPCFNGVVQTCQSVLQLLSEETSDPKIKYIITKKLNQDVIENLFARFRQKGGSNRNPTAKLLRTIFRSSLVNSLIKLPDTKNCEDDEEGEYIHLQSEPVPGSPTGHSEKLTQSFISPDTYIEPVAGPSGCRAGDTVDTQTSTSSGAGGSPSVNSVTLEECSLIYFAGYLAKTSLDKNSCQLCAIKLLKDIDLNDKTQLLILNKSYACSKSVKLKMPSDNLYELVRKAIDCFNMHIATIVHSNKIKSRLFNTIVKYLRCEAPQLLKISCEKHLKYIIDHMLIVKLHFYCKNKRIMIHEKLHPKLRILKNN